MSPRPTGLDQSWARVNPAEAAAAGVQVVSMYLSWDPTKNIRPADVKAYHRAGIAVMLNWENNAGAPLAGAAQARADATEAVRLTKALIKAVGYAPTNQLVIYFSCDRDVNAGQYGPIFAYYREAKRICSAAGFGVGAYGEASLVTALAKANITDAEWQTIAWSNGIVSPDADFYQYAIEQRLAGVSVDLDRVIHPTELGAWWPRGNQYDIAGDDLPITPADANLIVNTLLAKKITDPDDPKSAPTFAAWVVYGNKKAGKALTAATAALAQAAAAAAAAKAMQAVVDTASVASDIKTKLIALLGGQS